MKGPAYDYTALDAAILACIADTDKSPLYDKNVCREAAALEMQAKNSAGLSTSGWQKTYREAFRFTTARLQALRKAGRIACVGRKWVVVTGGGAA